MSNLTLNPAVLTTGARVWSRSFGAGTVTEAVPGCGAVFVRSDSGLEPVLRAADLYTVFPPEGWRPVRDLTDPRDIDAFHGPEIPAGAAAVQQTWTPDDGVTYSVVGADDLGLEDLRELARALNAFLAGR